MDLRSSNPCCSRVNCTMYFPIQVLMSRKYIQHGYTGQRNEPRPGRDRAACKRFHYATQNNMQFKTYELFISGIFHLILSDLEGN